MKRTTKGELSRTGVGAGAGIVAGVAFAAVIENLTGVGIGVKVSTGVENRTGIGIENRAVIGVEFATGIKNRAGTVV